MLNWVCCSGLVARREIKDYVVDSRGSNWFDANVGITRELVKTCLPCSGLERLSPLVLFYQWITCICISDHIDGLGELGIWELPYSLDER